MENRRNIMNIFFCHYRRILFRKSRRKEKFSTSACKDSIRTTRKSQNSLHSGIESIY